MPQQVLIHDGVFSIDQRDAINEMMEELYATQVEFDRQDASVSLFASDDSGEKELLAAQAVARAVQIVVTVTAAYADAGGTQPTISFGQGNLANKYATVGVMDDAAAEADFSFGGILAANQALTATLVAAITTGTGNCRVTSIAVHLNEGVAGDEIIRRPGAGALVVAGLLALPDEGP